MKLVKNVRTGRTYQIVLAPHNHKHRISNLAKIVAKNGDWATIEILTGGAGWTGKKIIRLADYSFVSANKNYVNASVGSLN